MLEEERQKAKTIRERMSGIAGGTHYGGYTGGGGYGGDGKYDSYNSKNYGKSNGNKSYSNNDNVGGMGVYGDYNYGKSTLDKYKNNDKNKSTNITGSTSPSIIPDITGGAGQSNPVEATKKPFQKIAPKLVKPQGKK